MTIRNQAQSAVANGLAIIPTKDKRPLGLSQDKPITEHNSEVVDSYWYASRAEMPPVGVVAEASGLMFLDIDVKNDVNGFETLDHAGLEIPETPVSYSSSSGKGKHYWFRAPEESLGKVTSRANFTYNGHKLAGVDNRIGNGYVVLPTDFEIPSKEVLESLPVAPEWLWKESLKSKESEATKFDGDHNEWLENLKTETTGAFSPEVQDIISRIPFVMDHEVMRNLQCALVKQGARGASGSASALEVLKTAYLRDQFNTPEYQREWDNALQGAIEKFGTFSEDAVDTDSFFDYNGKKKVFLSYEFAEHLAETTAIDEAGAFWSYENGVWSYDPDVHTRALSSTLKNAYQKNYESLVGDHLRSILVERGKFITDKPDPTFINVQNGMYNWKTGELFEHNQDYMSTVQLAVSYDPNAVSPAFDKWLSETLPDDEQLGLELIGYMLMSGNPKHIIPLLVGNGRNGKSTYLRLIQKMIGEKNYSSMDLQSLSTDKFAPVGLFGKLANICGDIHQKHLSNSGMLKKITGEDTISGERKGQNSFSFKPWATLIFSTNEMWSSSDNTDAYTERWLPVPFLQKFTAGKFDERILYAEINGIFNKAMVALRTLIKNGEFTTSDAQKRLMAEFKEDSDPILQWLNDTDYVRSANPDNTLIVTNRKDIYENYKLYRKGKGYVGPKKFYDSLEHKGYKQTVRSGYNMFYGIEVVDPYALPWSGEPSVIPMREYNNF